MGFADWIHHFFSPHCPDCAHDRECPSCTTLREQLTNANYEKERLLSLIIEKNSPERIQTPMEPIRPKDSFVPWNVRRQMLEVEDRAKARIMKENADNLEKEMGIASEKEGA